MFEYIKLALTKPLDIYKGIKMTKNTFFAYFIALVILTLVPVIITIPPMFGQFQDDLSEVDQQLPEFTTAQDKLETDHEEYIHLTDTVSLYFDPNNDLTDNQTIQRNVELNFSPINIALTENNLELYILGTNQAIAYENLPDFSSDQFSVLLNSMSQTRPTVFIVAFFALFSFGAILVFYELLLIVLINYFIAIFSANNLRLKHVIKISLLSMTIPSLTLVISQVLSFDSALSTQMLTIFSVILFFLSMRRYKNRKKAS